VACTPDVNPLQFLCEVTVEPAQPVEIRFAPEDAIGVARTHTSDVVATTHAIPIYFMAAETTYTVEASAGVDGPVATTTVVTGAPPPDSDSSLVVTGAATIGYIGAEHPCGVGAVAVIYDTASGELVWFRQLDEQGSLGLMNMVRFLPDHTILGETMGEVVQIDLLGNELVRFEIDWPGLGAHHDIDRRGDTFYAMRQESEAGLTLDVVVLLDIYGNEIASWDSGEHLDIPPGASGDFLHTNTIWVDDSGDIWLSFLSQASVTKIAGDPLAPDFGTPQWIMAGTTGANDIGFDVAIDWSGIPGEDLFSAQHNVHVRNDGRVMLLDNANGRALVLTLDEGDKTATVDAAYDTVEDSCGPQGTAVDTLAGNAIVACETGKVREYDLNTGASIWNADVVCANGDAPQVARWYPLEGW
jgi:hypothetical protein